MLAQKKCRHGSRATVQWWLPIDLQQHSDRQGFRVNSQQTQKLRHSLCTYCNTICNKFRVMMSLPGWTFERSSNRPGTDIRSTSPRCRSIRLHLVAGRSYLRRTIQTPDYAVAISSHLFLNLISPFTSMSESLSDKAQHWQSQWHTNLNSAHAPYQCHPAAMRRAGLQEPLASFTRACGETEYAHTVSPLARVKRTVAGIRMCQSWPQVSYSRKKISRDSRPETGAEFHLPPHPPKLLSG